MKTQAATETKEPTTLVGSPPNTPAPEVRSRDRIIADAIAAGDRDGLRDDQYRLDDEAGTVVTFKKLKLWDSVQIAKESGMQIDQLIRSQPLTFLGYAAWRCAVNGGYDMPFEHFAGSISFDRMDELGAVTAPFMGKAVPEGETSSG